MIKNFMNRFWVLLLFIPIIFSSCKIFKANNLPKKRVTANYLERKINENEINFDWFSSKIKIDIIEGSPINNLTANIRIKKDSIIWISISPFLGIEIARILITTDSVKILDRFNKKYSAKDISILNKTFQTNMDFSLLQKIISGHKIFFDKKKIITNIDGNYYSLISNSNNVKNTLLISPDDFTIHKMKIIHKIYNQNLSLAFYKYKKVGKQKFSFERDIDISGMNKILVHLQFSNLKINEPLSFPFNIPESYDKIQ